VLQTYCVWCSSPPVSAFIANEVFRLRPPRLRAAEQQLYDAVVAALKERGKLDDWPGLEGLGPEGLWQIVLSEFDHLPTLLHLGVQAEGRSV
jgi:hypothetical protein